MVNGPASGTHRAGPWRAAQPAAPPAAPLVPLLTVEGSYAGQLGPHPGTQTCAEQHKRPLTPQSPTRQHTNLPTVATSPVACDRVRVDRLGAWPGLGLDGQARGVRRRVVRDRVGVQGAGGAVEGEQGEQPGRAERFAWNRRTQQPDRPLISADQPALVHRRDRSAGLSPEYQRAA